MRQAEIELQDVQSARRMNVELSTGGRKNLVAPFLAIFIPLQLAAIIAGLVFMPESQKDSDFLYMLAGGVLSAFTTIISFYFGSSMKK